jgi:hypothetical protein
MAENQSFTLVSGNFRWLFFHSAIFGFLRQKMSRMRGFSHDTKSELLIHSHLLGASNSRFHMILKEATGLSADLEFS